MFACFLSLLYDRSNHGVMMRIIFLALCMPTIVNTPLPLCAHSARTVCSVAWCKKVQLPVEKVFQKTLLGKFPWAMGAPSTFMF